MARDQPAVPDRILEAAIREFGMHGYAGARVGRIGVLASVSKAALYYHHESKEALYDAAASSCVERLLDMVLPSFRRPNQDWVPAFVGAICHAVTVLPAECAFVCVAWRDPQRPESAGALELANAAVVGRLRDALGDGPQARASALVVVGASLGLILESLRHPMAKPDVDQVVDVLLHGVARVAPA